MPHRLPHHLPLILLTHQGMNFLNHLAASAEDEIGCIEDEFDMPQNDDGNNQRADSIIDNLLNYEDSLSVTAKGMLHTVRTTKLKHTGKLTHTQADMESDHLKHTRNTTQIREQLLPHMAVNSDFSGARTDFDMDWNLDTDFNWIAPTSASEDIFSIDSSLITTNSQTSPNYARNDRHVCTYCELTFGRRWDLQRHSLKHSPWKLKCHLENCNRAFYRIDKLRDHQRRKHRVRDSKIEQKKADTTS